MMMTKIRAAMVASPLGDDAWVTYLTLPILSLRLMLLLSCSLADLGMLLRFCGLQPLGPLLRQ